MPIGSRTSSWPSMMNSWRRTCRICWSVGMLTARAGSIAARASRRAPTPRPSSRPPRVAVEDEFLAQGVQYLGGGGDVDRARGVDRALDVKRAHFAVLDRDHSG